MKRKQQKLKRKICLEIVIEQVRSGDGLETGRISADREFLFSLMALVQIDCMACCGISGRRSQISRGHHHHPLKKVLGRARLVSRGPPAAAILSRQSGIRSGETHSRDFSCCWACQCLDRVCWSDLGVWFNLHVRGVFKCVS